MTDKQRRKFVTFVGAGSAAIPLAALVNTLPSKVLADDAEIPMVDESTAMARNWKYMSISDKADKSCTNCALYQGEFESTEGPCPLFPHMHVSVNAWCNAHSPSPS